MSFNAKRTVLILLAILTVIIAITFKDFFIETPVGLFILVIIFGILFVLGYMWWRCPKCKKFLGRYIDSSTHCKHCGEKLE